MTGLTSEQRNLLADRECDRGHRFDGVNYPTPEGVCPLCEWPDVVEQYRYYQWSLVEQSQPRESREALHQSVGLIEQNASPSLTASSPER